MANKEFICIYCGDTFTLSKEDQQLFDDGFLTIEPNECDECLGNNLPDDDADRISDFSDADNGL